MPSITGGDQLGEDYAPFLYEDEKKESCKNFHGYTSNPQLCKGCNRPVGEHLEFMAAHKEKKENKEIVDYKKKRNKLIELYEKKRNIVDYEKKRNKLIELSGTEIDGPEEMIDLGGVSMPVSLYEKYRDRFGEMNK
jgi:hypothetical protein